ncbi:type II toxin-antitoxin system RelE/ParE family toxin [Desulfobacter sp.]|jgi:putative addiction module killer protein|uniref:type II toxin-antitoxin system RelE/ParE family toxin n=1 Tax=Desulfobacter sp. TaxID=2294 RepID=UPI00257CB171|nr:type II toxin-antitoxin system RelE/ParE family toxin [Desulfobacter sp.]
MVYTIEKTTIFENWIKGIKSPKDKARIFARIKRAELGNLGDYKQLAENLFEMRIFFGSGFRLYYTIRDEKIIFLLCGGNKSSQAKDIKNAKTILEELKWE